MRTVKIAPPAIALPAVAFREIVNAADAHAQVTRIRRLWDSNVRRFVEKDDEMEMVDNNFCSSSMMIRWDDMVRECASKRLTDYQRLSVLVEFSR